MRDGIRLRRRGPGFVIGVERRASDGIYFVTTCLGPDECEHSYLAEDADALAEAIKKTAASVVAMNATPPPSYSLSDDAESELH